METTSEFDGSMAGLIVGLFLCLPVGIYYYISNKQEMWVCPECREAVRMGASTCPNCGENLDDAGDVGHEHDHDTETEDETDEF
ncbi:hypothetical protein [Haloarchaeobius litoreus]|uniref:Zinc-ribbon domain-containing protein n=1 Tax=Haloarchaeobius litoreus TaxID=755306 RepID=A0ABD6DDY8_9EURY|nr:hypothetical protein [Haloarchaeobius litoreus]